MWYHKIMLKTFQKTINLFVAVVFVTALFFCLNIGVNHANNGSASCCVLSSSHAAAYRMDFGEHLQHWKQIFTATRTSPNNPLVFLGILFVSLGFSAFILKFKNSETNPKLVSVKVYKERNASAKFFDHILQALSGGILNPKLYNLSSVIR
jgi:hypothetical protein